MFSFGFALIVLGGILFGLSFGDKCYDWKFYVSALSVAIGFCITAFTGYCLGKSERVENE